ncbi:MAG: 4-hydroxy-3-methylbut-2-enyl diphosphate reductase, partial [Helicobacteraceae bacterium 4484_230]
GVKSYAQNRAYVVENVEELEGLHLKDKVAIVAQTTRRIEEYLKITDYLIPRHKEVRVFNTICNATFDNQDAIRELSKEADVIIVIGGKNSSNTKQLHSIAKSNCSDSYLIECADDMDASWFDKKELCGISAGASTPDWIIREVVERIEQIV